MILSPQRSCSPKRMSNISLQHSSFLCSLYVHIYVWWWPNAATTVIWIVLLCVYVVDLCRILVEGAMRWSCKGNTSTHSIHYLHERGLSRMTVPSNIAVSQYVITTHLRLHTLSQTLLWNMSIRVAYSCRSDLRLGTSIAGYLQLRSTCVRWIPVGRSVA